VLLPLLFGEFPGDGFSLSRTLEAVSMASEEKCDLISKKDRRTRKEKTKRREEDDE
jgi:hypothetical protein